MRDSLETAEFDYYLPPDRIAQTPAEPRDASRLMVVDRSNGHIQHRQFRDLPQYLRAGDVLVLNDSRVIPARLFAHKPSGGSVEVLLLRRIGGARWEALVGGKRVRCGSRLVIEEQAIRVTALVVEDLGEARRIVEFDPPLDSLLERVGHTPLPPYIHTPLCDAERYQTVYSHVEGSAAAPTAGLHFTPELLLALRQRGVALAYVTLHIGLDTFKPVTVEHVAEHVIHSEWASLAPEAARTINQARLNGGRIVAVGTTAVRTLETAALRGHSEPRLPDQPGMGGRTLCQRGESQKWQPVTSFEGSTDLFIYPGFCFRSVELLVTNFHLPRSSLLMLVSAFAGCELVRHAYQVALAEGYRFFSFGDAMLVL